MKNLRLYSNKDKYNADKNYFEYPTVAFIEENDDLIEVVNDTRFMGGEIDYSKKYLTFEALEDGTFTLTVPKCVDSNFMTSISYSIDKGQTWTTTSIINSNQTITTPIIQAGNRVLWKGIGKQLYYTGDLYYSTPNCSFSSTGRFNMEGNIMSLLYGDNFTNNKLFPENSKNNFCGLFKNLINIINAKCLCIDTIAMNIWSCKEMFEGCTSLLTPPILPATTVENQCYYYMFRGCTSLTTAPELPATTLAYQCYYCMFQNCTGLISGPSILPSTTLKQYCYAGMFNGCTSLTTAPELPATTLAQGCYYAMFEGCTSLVNAPELPATTLETYCYQNMFSGCTSLNYIKCYAEDASAYGCTSGWVNGITSLGTFEKSKNATWHGKSINTIPKNWNVIYFGESDKTPEQIEAESEAYAIQNALKFTAIENTTFTLSCLRYANVKSVSYSLDNGITWTTTTKQPYSSVTITTPTITAGNSILWKGEGLCFCGGDYTSSGSDYAAKFSSTGKFKMSGNLMSLVEPYNRNMDIFMSSGIFARSFRSCTTLIDASELKLSTHISNSCYAYMFNGCTQLIGAPDLLTLQLDGQAYYYMFGGCSNLKYIKALFITGIENSTNWLTNVSSTGTFVKHPNAEWTTTGANGVPTNWNVVYEVEYLESDGNQYIDTGVLPSSSNFECEIKAHISQVNNTYDTILGSYDSNGTKFGVALGIQANTNNPYIQFGGIVSYKTLSVNPLGLHIYKTSCKNNTLKIDIDGTYGTQSFSGSLPNLSMYLFARHTSSSVSSYINGKIYYSKIWIDNELMQNLIPVRQGTTGYMCDKLTGTLYGNLGTGAFTLGNDVA